MNGHKLLDLVSLPEKNIVLIEEYLENLIETPAIIADEMNQTEQDTGKTVLHIAAESGNVDLVRILLDFDAPIFIFDKNKHTCEDLADLGVMSADTEDRKISFKKISALLRTRKIWQNKEDSTLLNRTIRVAEKAIKNVTESDGKTASLFVGNTTHGKSTLINFLLGVEYELVEVKRKVFQLQQKNPSIAEPAKVGVTCNSETTYPALYEHEQTWIADMPGYQGTREAEKICVAASTQMLSKQLGHIKGMIFVCCYNDLMDHGKTNFREIANIIGRIIMRNPSAKNNIVLAVTKKQVTDAEDENDEIELVCHQLKKLDDSLKVPVSINLETCSEGQDYIKNVAVKCVVNALLSSRKIIIADVTNSKLTRNRFSEIFNQLELLNPSAFNFSDFDGDMRKFTTLMEKIVEFHDSLILSINELEIKKENIDIKIQQCQDLINEKCLQLNEIEEKLNQPFNPEVFNKEIEYNLQNKKKFEDIINELEIMLNTYTLTMNNLQQVKINNAKHQINLSSKSTIIGSKAEKELQLLNQELVVQSESLELVIGGILNKINRKLTFTTEQYKACEEYAEELLENKRQAISNDEYIKFNSGPMIESLKIAISDKQTEMSELRKNEINITENLEKRQYEFDVNQSFFTQITKLFKVLYPERRKLIVVDTDNNELNTNNHNGLFFHASPLQSHHNTAYPKNNQRHGNNG